MSIEILSPIHQKRAQILAAAHELFVRQGYHGTSMRQIAKKAGTALGGLYNHFEGKEDVFHAVFMAYHPYHEVLPALKKAQGESFEEFVRDAADRMTKSLENRPDWLNLMFIEIVEFKNIHTSQLFNEVFPKGVEVVKSIYLKGEGRLRSIPPAILLRSFLGLFFSYYITEVILHQSAPEEFTENAMDYFVDIYLNGILEKA